ncbi:MAG: hypothetical protein JNJ55_14220, partial [Betaproteobacteria bacterium]|nr:hypothetical protein [Betaproteobacteria bacterium]
MRPRLIGLAFGVSMIPASLFANALADFDKFIAQTQAGRASFEQTVTDVRGKVTQKSNG